MSGAVALSATGYVNVSIRNPCLQGLWLGCESALQAGLWQARETRGFLLKYSMQLLPHLHIAFHPHADRGGLFSKLQAAGLGTLCWEPREPRVNGPCLPACGESAASPGQGRQGRAGQAGQGRAGLPGQHLHRGIPGSQAMLQCKQQGEFTKRQTRGTVSEPGTKAAGELWQGEGVGLGLLVASGHQPRTRKPPHAPPQ